MKILASRRFTFATTTKSNNNCSSLSLSFFIHLLVVAAQLSKNCVVHSLQPPVIFDHKHNHQYLPSNYNRLFVYTTAFRLGSGTNKLQKIVLPLQQGRRMSTNIVSEAIVEDSTTIVPGRPTWQQTMIRIKDPKKSLEFYCNVLGMTLIDIFDFPQYKFRLYFVTTLPLNEQPYTLTPGTKEAHDYLWTMEGVTLELTYNYGTDEEENNQLYHPGNTEGDGFGHIAVSTKDVYAATDKLLQLGYQFKKKPDEGRMKGLAFVYDPDGYWVEIVKRGDDCSIPNEMNFSQTMLRIKDPKKSIPFYKSFGMKVLAEKHFDTFSLYFLGSSNVDETINVKNQFQPVLELTHNHGTENDVDFRYTNGNEENKQGFGHIGFLVDDVYLACDVIKTMGYGFRKDPDGGSMKGLAFAYDPDGYSIEIIKRGGIDFGDAQVTKT